MSVIEVEQIVNTVFNSNTYILSNASSDEAWLVDIGDINPVIRWMESNGKKPVGLLITHSHFDHIYGIESLLDLYTKVRVYASEGGRVGLGSDRLNYSRYHYSPLSYNGEVNVVSEDDIIKLWPNVWLTCMLTPGHDCSCVTFWGQGLIFTGDSYIPDVKTVTHLRGNKEQARISEDRIKSLVAEKGLTVCPGHGPQLQFKDKS